MFNLSLHDHIRLSFGHVVYTRQAHTEAARRLVRRAWQLRGALLAVLALGAGAATAGAMTSGGVLPIAAATLSVAAFVAFATHMAIDFERRVYAHRWCAARLWLIAEQYRALLSEIHDGLLDPAAVAHRRDTLMQAVQSVYDHAPPTDLTAVDAARSAVTATDHPDLSDKDIDRLLPESLRKATV